MPVAAQVNNTGALYIPSGGNMATFGDLSNTNTGTITNSGNLYVHNNIDNNGTTAYDGGTLLLTGTAVQTLGGTAIWNTTDLILNNSNGFIMGKSYSIRHQVIFTSGIVNALTGSEPLELNPNGAAIAVSGASDAAHVNGYILQRGTGSFVYPSGDSIRYQPVAADLSVNSDGMLCRYFPTDAGSAPFLTTGLSSTPLLYYNNQEYWDLHPSGTATGTVSVYYDDYRGTAVNPGFDTVLKVAHKVAAGWNNEGGMVSGTQTAGIVTTMGPISSWSPFTLGSNYYLFNLPVELAGFTASVNRCNVTLAWTTETETTLASFDVQYSADGVSFATVGSVAPQGNHSSYTFDHVPAQGRCYYRLCIRDLDGSYKYSMVLAVNVHCNDYSITVYPNPVTSGEDLHVTLTGYTGEVRGILFDVTGRILINTVLANGHNIIHTDLLATGNYELGIISKENGREVYKIIVYR